MTIYIEKEKGVIKFLMETKGENISAPEDFKEIKMVFIISKEKVLIL